MKGIIIHIDADQGRALVWCEDHGDLALLLAPEMPHDAKASLGVGDLLDFEAMRLGCANDALRRCGPSRRVARGVMPTLPALVAQARRDSRAALTLV